MQRHGCLKCILSTLMKVKSKELSQKLHVSGVMEDKQFLRLHKPAPTSPSCRESTPRVPWLTARAVGVQRQTLQGDKVQFRAAATIALASSQSTTKYSVQRMLVNGSMLQQVRMPISWSRRETWGGRWRGRPATGQQQPTVPATLEAKQQPTPTPCATCLELNLYSCDARPSHLDRGLQALSKVVMCDDRTENVLGGSGGVEKWQDTHKITHIRE
ncbi:hypothetical protein C0Q70_09660 [Pomacea canaliculata]|uniref:Uncharacterized protein n=1 Tax=Pomacea canaliculata TaxID=400727 RepID=A0A2T7PAE7_POMCA|nr:hypothetical protein C0Q70_09660 [Pomacea canaliculata]